MTYGARRVLSLWVLVLLLAGLAGPARAQGDLLSVTDVKVDVTADNAQAAREAALTEAQRKAFRQLLERIVAPQDLARVPSVGDTQIADMVFDFDIASEQASAVRYIGTLNFRFDGGMVRSLLDSHGVSYQVPGEMTAVIGGGRAGAGTVVVLPVFTSATESRLFEGPSLWRDAWAAPPQTQGVQFVTPSGTADEAALIDAESALLGELEGLSLIGTRYRSDTVVVAQASLMLGDDGQRVIAILAQRYGRAGLEDTFSDQVPTANSTLENAFAEAVRRVADHTAASLGKAAPAVATKPAPTGPEQSIQVAVPIRDLNDWVDVQKRLTQAPAVTRTQVQSLLRTEVRLELYHTGDQQQLVSQLAQLQLQLSPSSTPGWWLLQQTY